MLAKYFIFKFIIRKIISKLSKKQKITGTKIILNELIAVPI